MFLYKRVPKGINSGNIGVYDIVLISEDKDKFTAITKKELKKGCDKKDIFITNFKMVLEPPKKYTPGYFESVQNKYDIVYIPSEEVSEDYIYLTEVVKGESLYYPLLEKKSNGDAVMIKYKELRNIPTMEILDYFGMKYKTMFLFKL